MHRKQQQSPLNSLHFAIKWVFSTSFSRLSVLAGCTGRACVRRDSGGICMLNNRSEHNTTSNGTPRRHGFPAIDASIYEFSEFNLDKAHHARACTLMRRLSPLASWPARMRTNEAMRRKLRSSATLSRGLINCSTDCVCLFRAIFRPPTPSALAVKCGRCNRAARC